MDRYMNLINTMRQGQDYLQQALDARDAAILRAIAGDDSQMTIFGKPVVLSVEWPEGPPWPAERLQSIARDMLDGINRRNGRES